MQQPERDALSQIVDSVADGAGSLDWDALESDLASDHDRALIRQLRILARISDVHRSAGEAASETVAAKVIGRIEPIPTIPLSHPARRADSGPGADSGIVPSGQAPEQWGSLQLVEKVGEGTFGEVYRAFDTQLHREVALKLLKPREVAGPPGASACCAKAASSPASDHPNVVVVHGAEAHDGRVGLWMEFIRGATLEQAAAQAGCVQRARSRADRPGSVSRHGGRPRRRPGAPRHQGAERDARGGRPRRPHGLRRRPFARRALGGAAAA